MEPGDTPFVPYDAPVEDVTGYLRTQIYCPCCSNVFDVEGDATGDTLQCDACGCFVHVEHVQ